VDLRGCFSELQLLEQLCDFLSMTSQEEEVFSKLVKKLDGFILALDNAEHIVKDVRSFVLKLQKAGEIAIVVTSQIALGLKQESRYQLEPFDLRINLQEAESIVKHWLQQQYLESEGNPHLIQLVQYSAGIPLMLELLAGQARQFSLETISYLTSIDATAELRHPDQADTLHEDYERLLAWSCSLLEDDELAVLEHASMFNIEFTIEDCRWVLGDSWTTKKVAGCLLRLTEKNLLQQRRIDGQAEPYFFWLVPLQKTMRGIMDSRDQKANERRHTQWIVTRLLNVQDGLVYEDPQSSATVKNLLPEINFALERVKSHQKNHTTLVRLGCQLVCLVYLYWMIESNYQEALKWLELILQFPKSAYPKQYIQAKTYLANSLSMLGNHSRAEKVFLETIQEARDTHSNSLSMCLQNYGTYLNSSARYTESVLIHREAVEISKSDPRETKFGLNATLNSLAIALFSSGEIEEGLKIFEKQVELIATFGSIFEIAFSKFNYGVGLLQNDQTQKGLTFVLESLSLFRECNDVEGQRLALLALGRVALRDEPQNAFERYEELLLTAPDQNTEIYNLAHIGRGICLAKLGQVKIATDTLSSTVTEIMSSATHIRTVEVFIFFLEQLINENSKEAAKLGIQLIGWLEVIFPADKVFELSAEISKISDHRITLIALLEPKTVQGALKSGKSIAQSRDLQRRVLRKFAMLLASSGGAKLEITSQQLEILKLTAQGLQNKELAKKLNISPKTVASHLEQLFDKFEVDNRTKLVQKALELGFLETQI
jgi:DNA-binding CsgD family transcriptional regulator/tetratricopeptide (TPR) repeat protein